MLRHWKHSNGTEATYTKLIQSLEQAGRKDLAEDVQNRKGKLIVFGIYVMEYCPSPSNTLSEVEFIYFTLVVKNQLLNEKFDFSVT